MTKRRSRKSKKRTLITTLLVVVVAVVNMFVNGTFEQKRAEDAYIATGEEGELQVHFLDVGQGDATLILQGEHAMLIDGGENHKGWQIIDYLKYLGVERLNYMVGTHPDSDHIGGLDTVLEEIPCDMVMMPELERDTASYEGLIEVLQEKGIEPVSPKPGDTYELGTAKITILAPNKTYENVNDNSIAMRIVHGGNSFLFTGDAENEAENDMLISGRLLSSDVYKVAHHGSSGANSELFLMTVKPEHAVISCGEGNDYGHPHSEVLNQLRKMGTKIYRTDEQGTIVAVSDGSEITFNVSPTESWQSGR